MDANEKIIDRFATRIRQMILQYHDVVKENGELYAWLTSATRAYGKSQAQPGYVAKVRRNSRMTRNCAVTATVVMIFGRKVCHGRRMK